MHLVSFSARSLLPALTEKTGVHVHYVKSPSYMVPPNPLLFGKIVRRIQPDVVHSGFVQTYGLCAAIANYRPILLMPWGTDILIWSRKAFLWNWVTKFTLSRADMITCDCELVKGEILRLVDFPEDRIVVFPWGIDLTKFNPRTRDDGIREKLGWKDNFVVIHDRQFKEVYGVNYLIEAIPRVVKEIPSARFLFCGTGPLEDKMKREVDERELASYVYFAGLVTNEELPMYLNCADVYVSCSLSDGTSVCLLEAMACGLPAVVSNLQANLEWIVEGENGLLTPPRNPEILAQRIIELVKNEELRKKFSERNIAIAEKRADWRKNVSILEGIYAKLVDV